MSELDPFDEGLEGKGKYYPMIVLSNKKLLLDDTFSDLVIKVGNETVQAHAAVICCRCEEILSFPTVEDKKKISRRKLEVKIKDGAIPPGIIGKVMEFLYTGMVDFPKLSDKEILSLGSAARYFKLGRLCYLCERWLREHMTIESVFHLLKAATDLKEDRVKGFCLQFALGHYNEFISNKDGIYILGIELFQEVVAAFQNNPTPPKEMRAEDTPDTLLEDFQRLYEQMPYSDITFTIRGESVKCHKSILAAHSDAFVSTIFKDESSVRVSPEAFRNVLRFTYFGDDRIEALPACELVQFSRSYKLPSLLRICEDKIRCSVSMETVLAILSIAYLPAEGKNDLVQELKGKCFPFILQNLAKCDLSMIKASNPLMIIDLLFELQTAWKNNQYGLGGALPANFNAGKFNNSPAPVAEEAPRNGDETLSSVATPTRPSRGKEPNGTTLLGAQRNRPAPPPRNISGANPLSEAPRESPQTLSPPPPRGVASPSPPSFESPPSPHGSATETSSDDGSSKKSVTNKKDKKDEDKRKKEESKRILKEKKERLKMEKKFKPKGKDIF